MEKKTTRRLGLILGLMGVILVVFVGLLYNLQITHYEDYMARTVKTTGKTETVAAARGDITDANGVSMVTNQVVYQVTLDTSLMGSEKNAVILKLLRIAQDQGITWPDNLPLGDRYPFRSKLAVVSNTSRANYEKLAKALGWKSEEGAELLEELRTYYKVDESLSASEARLLVGVLYELSLRQKDVVWSDYVFASGVDIDFISTVREQGLTGVNISPVTTRKYATTYAAHLLGRTGLMDSEEWKTYKDLGYAMNETVGKDGVEKAFESYLRGTGGTRIVERNAKGKIIDQTWTVEPKPGYDVALTLELDLQEKMEDILAERIPTLTKDSGGGAAVVIDVKTGGVLAMGSYPTYDLTTIYKDADLYNEALENPLKPFNNRSTQGLYSPGSTFKMVTAIAALEEDVIEPGTKIRDTGAYTYYGKQGAPTCWIYRQYRSTHGVIDVRRAIEVSCNVFFYDIGRRLGIDKLGEYARAFGLGEATGIEISERTGVVAGREYTESLGQTWYEGSVMYAAIGQENNQFTPLQLANYTATLANGGTHYAAHLLKEVRDSVTGQVVERYEPKVLDTLDIDPENLAVVKAGMHDLATTGSLKNYFSRLNVEVAAKTGSAQVAGSTSNAVFVCFAPYDDPEIAIALVAEKGGSGSSLAGLAAEIMDYYFNGEPEKEEEPAAPSPTPEATETEPNGD